MRLLTADQMRELDRRTIEEVGIPGPVLMENAGRAVIGELLRRFAALRPGPVLILAGKGNNGGDGFVVARCLLDGGWRVRTVVLAEKDSIEGDAALHLRALTGAGGTVRFIGSPAAVAEALAETPFPALVVDALLGTGLSSPVRGLHAEAIAWINASAAPVVAVDIPSGVDATSGRVLGEGVRADLTVTFAAAKPGLAVYPGAGLVGEMVVADIGIPAALLAKTPVTHVLVERSEAAALIPRRPAAGHKGSFGHLLLLAGSVGKTGAAALAASAAVRSGAGLVTLGCPRAVQGVLAVKLTEAMTAPLPDLDGALSLQALEEIRLLCEGKAALALGPGLGTTPEAQALVRRLVREVRLPMVIDADGLNALAGHLELLGELEGESPPVLTPHPGEMARLTGRSVDEVEADRLTAAGELARQSRSVVVLKGARTVIALPDGRLFINGSGNPGLASGGTGDVLTGLIGGLLAQRMPSGDAALLGVFLHGLAADRLAERQGEAGLAAGDLVRELPFARRELQGIVPAT